MQEDKIGHSRMVQKTRLVSSASQPGGPEGPADDGKRSDSFRSWTFHLEPEATNLNCLLERRGSPRERMDFELVLIEGWRIS